MARSTANSSGAKPTTPAAAANVTVAATRYNNLINIEKEAKKVASDNKRLKSNAVNDNNTIVALNGAVSSLKTEIDKLKDTIKNKQEVINELNRKLVQKNTNTGGKRSSRPKREELSEDVSEYTDRLAKYLIRKYIIIRSDAMLKAAAKEAYKYIPDKTDLSEEFYVDNYRFILYSGLKAGKNDTQAAAKARAKGKFNIESM